MGENVPLPKNNTETEKTRKKRNKQFAFLFIMHAGYAYADDWNGGHNEQALTSDLDQSSSYHRGVSFDTFNTRDATDFSLTLNYKHKDYVATRRSRTFLCGTDQNDYSDFALEWLIDELVDDGDEIVCLRAVEKDSKIASDSSVEEGRYRVEAEKLLEQVIEKNKHDEKAISLVMELAIGKVQEIIQRMVREWLSLYLLLVANR